MEELSPHEAIPDHRPPQRSPLRCALTCCGVIVLIGLAGLGGIYAFFANSQLTDPAQITAAVQEVVPGPIPAKLKASYGMKATAFGRTVRLGAFVHEEPQKLTLVVGDFPNTPPDYIHAQLVNVSRHKLATLRAQPTRIERNAIELTVGGSTYPAVERKITTASGAFREVFLLRGTSTGILFVGEQKSFDQPTMDAYLRTALKPAKPTPETKTIEAKSQ